MDLPRRYGQYVLLERIAVGGMGEIFRASYGGIEGFERLCAIKRILPHLSDDPEFIDRLISEAKIAVQLTHVNVVQVYELGRIENEYFIAMEWVDGPDLGALLTKARAKEIPLPLQLGIHICHELARAIEYAHRKQDAQGRGLGIIHRDISPQNVMVSSDGAVKLGDFGIARAGGIARKFATGMGAVLGKRRYMSPEQRRGEACDGRTDIYALGAMLYELVGGEAPDPDAERPPLSTKVKDLPPELDVLIAKALAQDTHARISDASELVEGLERIFIRLASAPGAVRDPMLELGRYVRKVSPPGEKQPQRRSLTDRMRAAIGMHGERASSPSMEGTAAVTVPVDISILEGAPEGVTIVHSAVMPLPMAKRRDAPTAPAMQMPPIGGVDTDIGPRPVFDDDDDAQTGSTEAVVRAPASAAETQVGNMRPVIPSSPPVASETMPTSSDVRRRRAVMPVEGTGETQLESARVTDRTPRSATGPMLVVGALVILGGAGALALRDNGGGGPEVTISTPTPFVVKTATPAPTPVRTPNVTAVAKATTPPSTPTPTPRKTQAPTPTPKATQTKIASATRTPPPPTPKATGFGMLTIGAEGVPWAYVTLNGKRIGTAPMFDVKVKAGVPHKIVLEHPEAGRREITVTVDANESKVVKLPLKR